MMQYRSLIGSVIGCCRLLMVASPGWPQGGELLMVTLEHPPHSFEADGRVTGASTEMLQRILTKMGYRPVFQILPWQ